MTHNKLLRSCMWWDNQGGEMGWKFSSSCHIGSSFSERNLPIMHTSSERGPRMIAGLQYTNPRSAVRSTEVVRR